MTTPQPLRIAVVGTGVAGLSAAWLLAGRHDVTLYEKDERVGGHADTVDVDVDGRRVAVDTGFIVFNRATYPNLTALFAHLGAPVKPSDMSFSASLDDGALEYSGNGLRGLFAQPRNAASPRFWSMLADLLRFYREARRDPLLAADETIGLGDYLALRGYGTAFRDDHIVPLAGAIWSAGARDVLRHPAAAFMRFNENHGLLQLTRRPAWETVDGGSRAYVERLTRAFAGRVRLDCAVREVRRAGGGAVVTDARGGAERYDHVVLATHADDALGMLADPTPEEAGLLGAFRYSRSLAVLHTDPGLMPKRRAAWASWNALRPRSTPSGGVAVTYWMNRLQGLATPRPVFVTLNPPRPPRAGAILRSVVYEHPVFDAEAVAAQRRLWSLQGARNTWFCGAYFGAGFHEDALQAGLAVAEELGGVRRPWSVPEESGRIFVAASAPRRTPERAA